MLTGLRTNLGKLGLNLTAKVKLSFPKPFKKLSLSALENELASLWPQGLLE